MPSVHVSSTEREISARKGDFIVWPIYNYYYTDCALCSLCET